MIFEGIRNPRELLRRSIWGFQLFKKGPIMHYCMAWRLFGWHASGRTLAGDVINASAVDSLFDRRGHIADQRLCTCRNPHVAEHTRLPARGVLKQKLRAA